MKRVASRLLLWLLAALAAGFLLSCDEDDSGSSSVESVESNVEIRLTSGAGLRGLTMTLRHSVNVDLVSVVPGDAPLATAACEENVGDGELIATCASTTTFAAPLDAWRLRLGHYSTYSAVDEITSLECEGSDAAGRTFAVACVAIQVP